MKLKAEAPFVECAKPDIVERGLERDVPDEHTWSCYRLKSPLVGRVVRVRPGSRRFSGRMFESRSSMPIVQSSMSSYLWI